MKVNSAPPAGTTCGRGRVDDHGGRHSRRHLVEGARTPRWPLPPLSQVSRPADDGGRAARPGQCVLDEKGDHHTVQSHTDTINSDSTDITDLDPVSLEHSEAGLPASDPSHPLQAGAAVREASPTFAELGVREEIVRALVAAGIERTFAIQELTLPLALAGEDVIGQARTGMGKTLGFGVPLLQRLRPASGEDAERDVPQALVVVP